VSHPFLDRHRATLDRAVEAIASRGYWTPFPESPSPKVYGEGAAEAGKAKFDALLNKRFPLTQPATVGQVGSERSPYGIRLGVTYPKPDIDGLMAAVEIAAASWRKAGPEAWVGVCLEILGRINKASFELANAIMHTTGQAFVMSFQAGGPHAQDRGLEAVHMRGTRCGASRAGDLGKAAGQERADTDGQALPHRAARRGARHRLQHVSDVERLPRHVREPCHRQLRGRQAASERGAPLAITVRIAREVLAEGGFDPNVVTLIAHEQGDDTAQTLALRPEVKIVDFTGSTANGRWLEEHARQAQVYTEKAGVNQVIVDSAADFKGLVRNLAFSLALYTGQMCTAPQNIYVPRDGIGTADGHLTFDQVASGLAEAVDKLLADPARAVEVLGAVVSDGVLRRLEAARSSATSRSTRARSSMRSFQRRRSARR
jgi:hypothetical protein